MADNLSQLLATPLQPLRARWRSPAQAELLRTARARHEQSPDSHWTWVAEQQRWMRPWNTVRTGELGDFTYFGGGQMNVADNCLDRWAEDPATADRTAVIWEGEPGDVRTVSYAELADETSRLAGALASLGVAKGDVVAIYMPNAIEAFTAVHACNRIGAIYTILFSGFGPDAVRSRLEASGAKVGGVEHTIVVDRTGRAVPLEAGELAYAKALNLVCEGIPAVPLEANDPAFLIFTSGTEARPKGVVHSVAGFLIGTWANVRWQVGPEDRDVYWVAADVGWLTFPIQAVVGGTGQRHDHRLLRRGHGHSNQRALLRDLREAPRDQGARRADPAAHAAQVRRRSRRRASAARASAGDGPGRTARRRDVRLGEPAPPGTKGNLVLAQPLPTLARTVWDDPERYQHAYFSRFAGYYTTNDEAVLDEDGHLWVLGRADDVINVAAHRISTLEIEAIATAHPQVAEAAVVGVSDATKGTVPIAFLTLLDGANPGAVKQEVSHDVTSQLGGYARLGAVYLTSALPKTRTGKIMRRLLRDVAEHGGPQGDTSAMEDVAGLQAVQAAVSSAKSVSAPSA